MINILAFIPHFSFDFDIALPSFTVGFFSACDVVSGHGDTRKKIKRHSGTVVQMSWRFFLVWFNKRRNDPILFLLLLVLFFLFLNLFGTFVYVYVCGKENYFPRNSFPSNIEY